MDHRIEDIHEVSAGVSGTVSVMCSCGQQKMFGFVLPSGRAVAKNMAHSAAFRHMDDPKRFPLL